MKIIEALKELPLIEKKIQKKIQQIGEYSSNLDRGVDTDLPFSTATQQQKEVDALIQSVKDLVQRKAELRTDLAVTNSQVFVTINNLNLPISQWIEYRENGLKNLINSQKALTDTTAMNMSRTTQIDMQKGVKSLRFFDESVRNIAIDTYQDTLDRIDAELEIINATTDMVV